MSDPKQARVLLEAAERDYSALCGMGDATIFADEIFGFHVQQALEKSLKALLALHGKTYPPTHDLSRLINMLKEHDAEAARFDGLVEYTSYAVQFRYGAGDTSAMPLDRATSRPARGSVARRSSTALAKHGTPPEMTNRHRKTKGFLFSPHTSFKRHARK